MSRAMSRVLWRSYQGKGSRKVQGSSEGNGNYLCPGEVRVTRGKRSVMVKGQTRSELPI